MTGFGNVIIDVRASWSPSPTESVVWHEKMFESATGWGSMIVVELTPSLGPEVVKSL